MNKTIYVRDEDVPVWERARELAGDKLSPVISEALKRYVAEKEITEEGFQRIVVNYREDSADRPLTSKAFQGKWLIRLDEDTRIVPNVISAVFAPKERNVVGVALTAKQNFAIVSFRMNGEGVTQVGTFKVYSSIAQMAESPDLKHTKIPRLVQERYGMVPVEELDI